MCEARTIRWGEIRRGKLSLVVHTAGFSASESGSADTCGHRGPGTAQHGARRAWYAEEMPHAQVCEARRQQAAEAARPARRLGRCIVAHRREGAHERRGALQQGRRLVDALAQPATAQEQGSAARLGAAAERRRGGGGGSGAAVAAPKDLVRLGPSRRDMPGESPEDDGLSSGRLASPASLPGLCMVQGDGGAPGSAGAGDV